METIESMSYVDSANSPATHPTLPTSIAVEVVDPVETCGSPSLALGKHARIWSDNQACLRPWVFLVAGVCPQEIKAYGTVNAGVK